MKIEASFVRSAASAGDLPRDGRAEIALIGRSNVGKSSLINALTRRKLARTSGAPGKTRLANVYRVARGSGAPIYLVDLPGYGYARGDREDIDRVIRAYFGQEGPDGQEGQDGKTRPPAPVRPAPPAQRAALLLVDSRHPGLQSDIEAWSWIQGVAGRCALAVTKIDKLSRGERIRALQECESVFETSVMPVSARTGEGLDELWKTIEQLASSSNPGERRPQPRRLKR